MTKIRITIAADVDPVHLGYMVEQAMTLTPDTGSLDVRMEPSDQSIGDTVSDDGHDGWCGCERCEPNQSNGSE